MISIAAPSRQVPGATASSAKRSARTSTPASAPAQEFVTDDPAFGIWRDRQDMTDVADYVRHIREPRYTRDGSRKQP